MLVLTRHEDEALTVYFPDGTTGRIVLVKVKGAVKSAKLGFEFPPGVKVLREELGTWEVRQ